MKPKQIILLVGILVVLAALVVLKQAKDKPASIEDAVKLTALMPEGVAKTDITKIELYAGGKPDEKVVLERTADAPDKWQAANHFNAPVAEKKITELLDALADIKGEPREQEVADEGLKDYELANDTAFHVAAYTNDPAKPACELLVGKSLANRQSFARFGESKNVYLIAHDVRAMAGLRGGENEAAPTPATWLDKGVLELDQAKLTRFDMKNPYKHLVLQREEKPEEKPAEPASAEGETPATPEPKEKQYEWKVAEGADGVELKQAGFMNCVRSLSKLNATDFADPAKKAELGLDAPAYTCTIAVEGQEAPIVIQGARQKPSDNGYILVPGREPERIYEVAKNVFEMLFGMETSMNSFELPGLTFQTDQAAQVAITQPEGNVRLAKEESGWKALEPAVALELQTTAADGIVRAMSTWKAAEYLTSAEGVDTGLDAPTRTITVTLADGSAHTLTLGKDSAFLDGVYARLDSNPAVLLVRRSDITRLFPALKDLFSRQLLDVAEEDLASITVERGGAKYELTSGPDGWKLNADGNEQPANSEAVEHLVAAITDAQAEDILFTETSLGGEPASVLRIRTAKGDENVVNFGVEKDNKVPVMLGTKLPVFALSSVDATELLPNAEALTPPPAEPAKPETAEPAPAGAIAPAEPATAAPAAAPAITVEPPAQAVSITPEIKPAPAPTPSVEVKPAPPAETPAAE